MMVGCNGKINSSSHESPYIPITISSSEPIGVGDDLDCSAPGSIRRSFTEVNVPYGQEIRVMGNTADFHGLSSNLVIDNDSTTDLMQGRTDAGIYIRFLAEGKQAELRGVPFTGGNGDKMEKVGVDLFCYD